MLTRGQSQNPDLSQIPQSLTRIRRLKTVWTRGASARAGGGGGGGGGRGAGGGGGGGGGSRARAGGGRRDESGERAAQTHAGGVGEQDRAKQEFSRPSSPHETNPADYAAD